MREADVGADIVIHLVTDGRSKGEKQAALDSLRQFLSRESIGSGAAEVKVDHFRNDDFRDDRFKGGPWADIAYHALDGTAEALATTLIAAVGAWCHHWYESHHADAEVEVVEQRAEAPGDPEDPEEVTTVRRDARRTHRRARRSAAGDAAPSGPATGTAEREQENGPTAGEA